MTEYLAVAPSHILSDDAEVKRLALLFDRVVVMGLGRWLWVAERDARAGSERLRTRAAEVEWLRERGVLADPRPDLAAGMRLSAELFATRRPDAARGVDPRLADVARASADSSLEALGEIWARVYCVEHQITTGDETVPVLLGGPAPARGAATSAVARVILNVLPMPDDSTPWEAVLEFRADPDARRLYVRLKHWLNGLAARTEAPNVRHLEDELRYLIAEYEAQLALHRLKAGASAIETLLVAGGSVLEHVFRLRWGEAAKALFVVSRQRAAVLEAERAAAGRETAYVLHCARAFARRG